MLEQDQTTVDADQAKMLEILRSSRGEKTGEFIALIPGVMAELTQQCIDNPDVRVRERLRAYIKALLTFVMSDTDFPLKQEGGVDPAGSQPQI